MVSSHIKAYKLTAETFCLFSHDRRWIVACLEETQNILLTELHILCAAGSLDALLTLKVNLQV